MTSKNTQLFNEIVKGEPRKASAKAKEAREKESPNEYTYGATLCAHLINGPYRKTVGVRLPADKMAVWQNICQYRGVNSSDYLRYLLAQCCAQYGLQESFHAFVVKDWSQQELNNLYGKIHSTPIRRSRAKTEVVATRVSITLLDYLTLLSLYKRCLVSDIIKMVIDCVIRFHTHVSEFTKWEKDGCPQTPRHIEREYDHINKLAREFAKEDNNND